MLPTRPLTGEPLCLDLINTVWVEGSETYDLLATKEGTRTWLEEQALRYDAALLPEINIHLLVVRAALRGILENPNEIEHRWALNQALQRGRMRYLLSERGPEESLEVAAAWEPAWRAASDLLRLLREAPERLKRCANPKCVLHFLDTSPKNARSWHDMKTCGNRAKAARHYRRTHG
jgi:predicted RNA-binding Zn ribbon-like protein